MQIQKILKRTLRPGTKRFYQNYRRALSEFSRSLTLIIDFDQLLENLVGKLREIVDIPVILILLRDPESNNFILADSRGIEEDPGMGLIDFSHDDKLVRWLTINETHLVVADNPGVVGYLSGRENEIFRQFHIQIVVPLLVMNQVTGIVLLGSKKSGQTFTREEIELLTTLLGQSALAFENALLYQEQKQRLRKMFRTDRLATIGQIAAGAAHEIRNPLTSIRSTIQYLNKKNSDPDKGEMFHEMMSEVDRIDEIIQGLLSFSKPQTLQKEQVELNHLIHQVLTLTASTARKNSVQVVFQPSKESETVAADPNQLKQVFLNIILNAIQAMNSGGTLTIQIDPLRHVTEDPTLIRGYRIQFRDTGHGIPEEQMETIFDPFYTTKKDGTGLGLSICYGIIQQHNGEIEVTSKTSGTHKGTLVSVILPRE
jgi:signal transduction histidine kinase